MNTTNNDNDNDIPDMSLLCTDSQLLQREINQLRMMIIRFRALQRAYVLPESRILAELTKCQLQFETYTETLNRGQPLLVELVFSAFCRARLAEEKIEELEKSGAKGKMRKRHTN